MSGNLRQVLVYNEDQSEILPKAGTYVIVEVSTVLNPNHFYVLLPWGPHTVKEVKEETKGATVFFLLPDDDANPG